MTTPRPLVAASAALLLLALACTPPAEPPAEARPEPPAEAPRESPTTAARPEAPRQAPPEAPTPTAQTARLPAQTPPPEPGPAAVPPPPPHAAAGHVPPIDCPLAAAGHDPTRLRPFDEVADYIAFLERADRAAWQKPDDLVAALGLSGDEVVVDLGAGSGYFAFRFAAVLPRGRVEALDVEPEMVRHLHHHAMTRGVANLHAGFVDAAAPTVPSDTDLVFVCDVLHHVAEPQAWLSGLAASMPAGSRLALVEFREGELPQGPPEAVKLPRTRLLELARQAGLELVDEPAGLLPYQHLLVFAKP